MGINAILVISVTFSEDGFLKVAEAEIYINEKETNDMKSIQRSSTPINIGVVVDYIGFDEDYLFQQRIRGKARTQVLGLNGDPIPEQTLFVSGSLTKNGIFMYGMPSTSGFHLNQVDTYSPYDNNPTSGARYVVRSYHTVHDFYGTVIWDTQHGEAQVY